MARRALFLGEASCCRRPWCTCHSLLKVQRKVHLLPLPMELLLLLLHLVAAVALEVKTSNSPVLSLVYSQAVLHCNFTVHGSIKKDDVAVKWAMKSVSGEEKPVYQFDGNHMVFYRHGSWVNTELLPSGVASLVLSNVTLMDEGVYTCTVLVTPQYGNGKIQLKVRAQPSILLSPQSLQITAGEEKTFFCDVHDFYPPAINITWLVQKQGALQVVPSSSNICTGVPSSRGRDGLFSVLSRVTHVMNETNNGSLYICQVQHETLKKPLRRNTTLFVTTPKLYNRDTGFIIGVAVVCIVVTGSCSIFYQKCLAKVEPNVSSIIQPDLIPINEKLRLMCTISGFRPKAIEVKWYRKNSHAMARLLRGDPTTEDASLLESAEDVTIMAKQSLETHGRFYSVSSYLELTPTIKDDGAKFECTIQHSTLKSPVHRTTSIHVTARPASYHIFSWPQTPVQGEKFILICVVERFYPNDIALVWFRNRQPVEKVTQFGPFPCEGDFYSIWSQTEFNLSRDDEGAIYTCQIKHSSFGNVEELSYQINLQGIPPQVLWITADPSNPVAGEELRLSCRINNFSPNLITVNWFQDGKLLHKGICNSVSVIGTNGLHSMWSLLRITPLQGVGRTVFTCRVEHGALRECVERSYPLEMPGEPCPFE